MANPKKMKTIKEFKKFKRFNLVKFAVPIIERLCPFGKSRGIKTPRKDYSNEYFFICLLDFVDTVVSWQKYRGTIDYPIQGKYLNQIHNKFCRAGVYDQILKELTEKYLSREREDKIKIQIIDSSFVANKQGDVIESDSLLSAYEVNLNKKIRKDNKKLPKKERKRERHFVDFNRYNGRKKYIKKDIIVNSYGYILAHNTSSSKRPDSQSLAEIVKKLPASLNTKKNSKVNRYKQNFLADSGYSTKANKLLLEKKGYTPIIRFNKRNTKNKTILAQNKMTPKKKQIFKKRYVVEATFAWLKNRPVINQIYERSVTSYNGLFALACSVINSNKI